MKKYQTVIQFPESFFDDFDAMIEFEDKLIQSLPHTHEVDGHDAGAGTINFFIHTDSPKAVLANFRKHLGTNKVEKSVCITFRELTGDKYIILWPKNDERDFTLIKS